MPFTFAHPAAVLAIPKRLRENLGISGLVIGSMAPDFEYLLRGVPIAQYGHDFAGFLWFNLPLCFAVYWLFERVVKRPLLMHLPVPWDRKLATWARSKPTRSTPLAWGLFAVSAVLGMATHVFWDNFTHAGGYFVRAMPVLASKVSVLGVDLPVYKLLQHGSTLFAGLLIILYVSREIHQLPARGNSIKASAKLRFWLQTVLFAGAFTCFYLWLTGNRILDVALGSAVVLLINSGLAGLLLASLRARSH